MSDHQPNPQRQIFRAEAVTYHLNEAPADETLPDAPPAWTQWGFAILLTGTIAAVLILILSGAPTFLIGGATR